MRTLLKEPTLHFLLIGAVLFAVDFQFTLQRDDPSQIIIDEAQLSRLIDIFQEGQGRLPEPQEIDNLLIKWTQNEVFYREAQALGLDQGDEMMRSRLILKMRNILFNRISEESPDEVELRDWFELNKARYDEPERYTIERLTVTEASDAEAAEALATALGNSPAPEDRQGDVREYARRSAENLVSMLGESAQVALTSAPTGQWVPVEAAGRRYLARVVERHAPVEAEFERVRTDVIRDFRKVSNDLRLAEMAGEIAAKYQMHLDFEESEVEQILASRAANYEQSVVTADSRSLKARAGVSNLSQDGEDESPTQPSSSGGG